MAGLRRATFVYMQFLQAGKPALAVSRLPLMICERLFCCFCVIIVLYVFNQGRVGATIWGIVSEQVRWNLLSEGGSLRRCYERGGDVSLYLELCFSENGIFCTL